MSFRSMPAAARALSRMAPAGPTNGRPCKSSLSPGCSPTITTRAVALPSPKTVCVPSFHRWHALHPAAAARKEASVGLSGTVTVDARVERLAMVILMHLRQSRAASFRGIAFRGRQWHEVSYGVSHLQHQEAPRIYPHHAAGGKNCSLQRCEQWHGAGIGHAYYGRRLCE